MQHRERELTPQPWVKESSINASKLALFLDLDGTLIDIASTPTGAVAPPGLADLVESLALALGGALAIVSGRSIADLDRLLAPARFCAAGVHGAEIRETADGAVRLIAPALTGAFIESVRELAQLHPGIVVETKSAAIAVHYRQAEDQAGEVERRLRALVPESDESLDLRPGRKVAEVIQKHVSKGAAVQSFMHHAPFSDRLPVMIGDDFTDISAFDAVESFGGRGFRVAGEFFEADVADFRGTADVRRWLGELSDRIATVRADGGSGGAK
jgi:trehalose 6-phosphate phosphatase